MLLENKKKEKNVNTNTKRNTKRTVEDGGGKCGVWCRKLWSMVEESVLMIVEATVLRMVEATVLMMVEETVEYGGGNCGGRWRQLCSLYILPQV